MILACQQNCNKMTFCDVIIDIGLRHNTAVQTQKALFAGL